VRGHDFDGLASTDLEKTFLAGRVELQNRRAELKALRPFGPASGRVFSFDREDRSALFWFSDFLDAEDFLPRQLEQPLGRGQELLRGQSLVDFDRHFGKKFRVFENGIRRPR
jgi:hypothetical protein